MGRETLLEHLELAGDHIAKGAQHLAKQKQLIERLQREGLPTDDAEEPLRRFEATQRSRPTSRERIEGELATAYRNPLDVESQTPGTAIELPLAPQSGPSTDK